MKKLVSALALTLLMGCSTLSAQNIITFEPIETDIVFSIEPRVDFHIFSDFDNAAGAGAQVNVDNSLWFWELPVPIRFSGGFEILQTEGNVSTTKQMEPSPYELYEYESDHTTIHELDLEIIIANLDVSYVHPVTNDINIYALAGLDIWFIGNDGSPQVDNTIGAHFGGGAEFILNDLVSVKTGAAFQFAETDVSVGGQDVEIDLDNINFYASANIIF